MVALGNTTPFRPRRVRLDFADVDTTYFFNGNPLLSTFIASLSAVFPPGEREFVRSVANFSRRLPQDGDLAEAVRSFSGQEAQHAQQHRSANVALDKLGYRATHHAEQLDGFIQERIPGRTGSQRLALTAGAEHLTAILGLYVLRHPHVLDGLPTPVRQLLLWHAVEEIEHKSVAFDVYMTCVGDRTELRRMFLLETVLFLRVVLTIQWHMLAGLKARPKLSDVREVWRVFMGRDGIVPHLRSYFLAYLRDDFHPTQIDDADLLDHWRAKLAALETAAHP